jgi:arylsulfate sulfotransferase
VVNSTAHPLVFLYSAPPCARGAQMQVEFFASNGSTAGRTRSSAVRTPFQACDPQFSMNFYLMGLYAETNYMAHHIIVGSELVVGPSLAFKTGSLPANLFTETVIKAPTKEVSDPVLLGSALGVPVATDLNGAVLWYGPSDITFITRPEAGGIFWGLTQGANNNPSSQSIRKFDATGGTLLETNAARVNEQLAALGRRQITGFHHEVRTLPDGSIAALADVEQILTNVQGPGPVDVIGDMIIVFDSQLNVLWAWDAFDHLDVTRKAVLGETCLLNGACAPYNLAADANDWTHGNSISQTPDGNLLYSARHQDWVIKISYNNGKGDGHVIWRLGKDGDFTITSTDIYPWFSHQHDANFETASPSELMLFDDGNTRVATLGSGNSRGQVLQLDETSRVASFVLNADLGVYSLALGSAQKLTDGDYFFDAGFVLGTTVASAYSVEVSASGQIVSEIQANALLYRSFRMPDLYTPD